MGLVALTREVAPSLVQCELTFLERCAIDVGRARVQHDAYEQALRDLGCTVRRLPPAPELPDSVFVEDTAVVLEEIAVVARPGAASRQPETGPVKEALRRHRPLRDIEPPGTLDGGDVLRLGRSIFVGVSGRTNEEGVRQLAAALEPFGYRVTRVRPTGCLHLKTAVTAAADDLLLCNPEWVDARAFGDVRWLAVDPREPHAANVLRIGDTVLCPASAPYTRERLEQRGLRTRPVDQSELAKAEAGLTCCSLIFEADEPPQKLL